MNTGDRVKVVKSIGLYSTGCEGIVDSVSTDGSVNVSLDKDETGAAISPPEPMPPVPADHYQVI